MQDGSHATAAAAPELRVRYFAVLKELAGVDEEGLPLGPGLATVAELLQALEQRHPALAGRLGRVRVARNQRLAAPGERLAPGDVLQLIPPLAGG